VAAPKGAEVSLEQLHELPARRLGVGRTRQVETHGLQLHRRRPLARWRFRRGAARAGRGGRVAFDHARGNQALPATTGAFPFEIQAFDHDGNVVVAGQSTQYPDDENSNFQRLQCNLPFCQARSKAVREGRWSQPAEFI